PELADDFDHGALAALGRYARRGEQIHAFLLVQGANGELELRIGEDARYRGDSRSAERIPGEAEKQGIDRICADREITAAIASRDGIGADRTGAGRREREVQGIEGGRDASRTAATEDAAAAGNIELPEQPVETQFFQVVLL